MVAIHRSPVLSLACPLLTKVLHKTAEVTFHFVLCHNDFLLSLSLSLLNLLTDVTSRSRLGKVKNVRHSLGQGSPTFSELRASSGILSNTKSFLFDTHFPNYVVICCKAKENTLFNVLNCRFDSWLIVRFLSDNFFFFFCDCVPNHQSFTSCSVLYVKKPELSPLVLNLDNRHSIQFRHQLKKVLIKCDKDIVYICKEHLQNT